jgi:hypothetical protein
MIEQFGLKSEKLEIGSNDFAKKLKEDLQEGEYMPLINYLRLATDMKGFRPLEDRQGIHGGSMDGTTHRKYEDGRGEVWMAKSYPEDRLHRALADVVVAKLSSRLGLETTMDAQIGVIDDEPYSFVKWEESEGSFWENVKQAQINSEDNFSENISKQDLILIVREHVLDWLVSNHDAHPGHFLEKKGDGLICIDKAQAFKYIGTSNEKLSVDYDPNERYNGKNNFYYMPIYNSVWKAIVKGKTELTMSQAKQEIENVIKQVESIGDEEYFDMLESYAIFRFELINSSEDSRISKEDFMELVLKRKNEIRHDFTTFLTNLEK